MKPEIPERGAFIVGVSRSGTTLLSRLLDGHPEIVALPGETFLTDWCGAPDPVYAFFQSAGVGKDFASKPKRRPRIEAAMRARLRGPCGVRDGMRALLEALLPFLPNGPERPKAVLWLEKTPRHRHRVPVLVRAFGPETRILYMVRDPRAVFASKAGAPDNPDWYHNLLANHDAAIEVGDGQEISLLPVRARDLPRDERDPVWETQKERYPGFADYETKTTRQIPVGILEPAG